MDKGHGKYDGFKGFCPQGVILGRSLGGLGLAYHLRPILTVYWESFSACLPGPGLVTTTEVRFVISVSHSLPLQCTCQSFLWPHSSTELSVETDGKTHYRSGWTMMKRCRAGGEEEGEEVQEEEDEESAAVKGGSQERLTAADESCLSSVSESVCGGRSGRRAERHG